MQNLLPLGPLPVILQQAFLKIIDKRVCNAPYALSGLVTDTMLCAGFMSGEADACQVLLDTLSNHFSQVLIHWKFLPLFFFFGLNDFNRVASYFNPPNKYLFISLMYQTPAQKLEMQW